MNLPEKKILATIGENLAVDYLVRLGYKIVCRNYSTAWGELDVVAVNGSELIIAEVKTRTGNSYVAAENAINLSKQKKITLAALKFLNDNPSYSDLSCRFDAILVLYDNKNDSYRINHLPNAFYPVWNADSELD
jgi:putative endonuclease